MDLAMVKFRAFCLLFASVVFAQTPDTATIQGQVTDPSRAAVPGVHIAARNQQNGLERTALTDAAGNYSLPGLPVAGAYQITATKQGFADAEVKDVTLAGGATAGDQPATQRGGGTDAHYGHRGGGRGPHGRSRKLAHYLESSRLRRCRCSAGASATCRC